MCGHLSLSRSLIFTALWSPAMALRFQSTIPNQAGNTTLHQAGNKIPNQAGNTVPDQGGTSFSSEIWSQTAKCPANMLFNQSNTTEVCKQIHGPSKAPYKLMYPMTGKWHGSWSQDLQDLRLAKLWNTTSKGFFIESGAADGEQNSNTILFEIQKGWTGLLVEPDPISFKALLGKNRKAHAFNGALSITGHVGQMYLHTRDCAHVKGDGQCSTLVGPKSPGAIKVQLMPLEMILACLQQSVVDFWSLDVEGMEGQILKTFPFEKVEVGVLLIEMNKNENNNMQIEQVMQNHGFKECGRTRFDRIYVNPQYYKKRGLSTPEEC
eukprot:gnl/TRDRNA2_/TRDRNA2_172560_c0_seq2.p1 gnl/TRDRNA2_/TRDRNA2_172560_c0~~gnl/TRDRNA2_/TRDRNA2_172560_c0_seq2.p1  ORF type:complete len:322 (+),score=28.81 gnl/TRDRNA2_/TRDRNA2_172560_c0_seq2:65-1030(+)